jgi:hypothetical protein
MSSISFSNKNDDNIIELMPSSFSKSSPFNFNIPSKNDVNNKRKASPTGDLFQYILLLNN